MTEQEQTPELNEEQAELARRHGLSEEAVEQLQAVASPSDVPTDERAELMRRYGLSVEDLKRVRGESWAERCEDAKRLADLAEPQSIRERARRHLQAMQEQNPNLAELTGLASLADKQERQGQLLRSMHRGEDDEPQPQPSQSSDFDGGAREPAPLPPDPIGDHDELLIDMLRAKELRELEGP